jgi:tetratricopeptide (TPR) repeat protein
VRRSVADVRTDLADVKALANAGRYKDASKKIPAIVDAGRATKYQPVIAETILQLAELQELNGDFAKSEKNYEDALWMAEASRYDEVAAEATAQLIAIVGYHERRHREGERWAQYAKALLHRLGPGHDVLAGWRSNNLALIYQSEGRFEESLANSIEAVALKKVAFGENNFDVAISLMNVAQNLFQLERIDEAIETNNKALKILRSTVGSDQPLVAFCLSNGAEFANARGRYVEAKSMAEEGLLIAEREFDVDHPFIAYPLTAVGWALIETGKPALALPYLERALRIREGKDPDPIALAETRFALARALAESGRLDERVVLLADEAHTDFLKSSGTKKRALTVAQWISSHETRAQQISMR